LLKQITSHQNYNSGKASFGLPIDGILKGFIMGYTLQTSKLCLRKPRRIFRTPNKLFKLFLNLFILISFLISVPMHIKRAMAIETVKASALSLEDARDGFPLSYSSKNPPSTNGQNAADTDPCLPLLSLKNGSPLKASFDMPQYSPRHMNGRPDQRPVGHIEKTAAPAALSFLLGVRIALGPKKIVKKGKRVQITSNLQASNVSGQNHALSIAAYRSCKNEHALRVMK